MSARRISEAAPLVVAGAALEAIFIGIVRVGDGPGSTFPLVVLLLAAALVHVVALVLALRTAERVGPDRDVVRGGAAYTTVVVLAVVFRATLVLAPPALSPDAYRYAWEGRVQVAGESPYAHAPEARELKRLRDASWERVEHRHVPAIYGPLAEITFAGAALLPERARLPALKAFFALADLATLLLVTRALKRRGLPAVLALAHGWHPLAVVEFAGEGHLDSLPIALLMLALEGVETGKPLLAGIALGLSASPKYLTLALVPALARRSGWRAGVLAVLAFALPFLVYLPSGGVLTGLNFYAQDWRFNETGYLLLEKIAEGAAKLPFNVWKDFYDPYLAPRLLAGGIFAAVALGLGLRSSFERAAFAAIACVVFLSPVVHPWYVLWLVPFLAWRRSAAWLELTLAVSVVYAARIVYDGSKESWLGELRWPRLLWMGGFVAIALLGPILGGSVRGRGVSRAAL